MGHRTKPQKIERERVELVASTIQGREFRVDRITWMLLGMLAVLVAVSLGRVGTAEFVDFDDDLYVFNNPRVMGGWNEENVSWAWTTTHGGFWMPLTWMSLQFDASLGTKQSAVPPGEVAELPDATIYHVHNVVLHVIAAWMLFLFLYRTTKRRDVSFLAALIWAVHPLRVESVAWVTERKDVLAGVYGFLAMYLYVVWRERRHWASYAGTCVAMGLSLMAKPLFVTLPLILVLVDFWPLGRIKSWRDLGQVVLEKGTMLILMVGGSVAAYMAQRDVGAVMSQEEAGWWMRIGNAVESYGRYLWMQVNVGSLGVFYPFQSPPLGAVIGVAAVLLGVTGLCLWQRTTRPWLLMGWLWYLGTFVPMIGIVQAGKQGYADRFTYLPAVGLLIMAVYSVPEREWGRRWMMPWIMGAGAAVAAVLMAFTIIQSGYWSNTNALFTRTLEVTPENTNYVAHHELGKAYSRGGDLERAEWEYEQALAINPRSTPTLMNLGGLFLRKGFLEKAIPVLRRAVESAPTSSEAHNLYGTALGMLGRFDEANAEFGLALKYSPDNQQALRNLQVTRILQTRVSTTRSMN